MRAQLGLLGVEGRDEERLARVPHADALSLHVHVALGHHTQEDVGELCVEEVDVIDVQHAAMRLGQQSRLEHGLALLHRLLHIHGPEEAIIEHIQRHLDKGALHNLPLEIGERLALRLELRAEEIVHVKAVGISVERVALDALDGREQPVQRPGHHRLPCATTSSNDNTSHVRVHCSKKQRSLDWGLADDERHRESLLAHATLLVLRLGQRLVHSRGTGLS
mmetsp:Transcript_6747/g.15782  ORF Transcript_6747/g.15782 Transcript_6747/m.15782 type:complete len:221 (+) Transcript_6747:1570-2232(+)